MKKKQELITVVLFCSIIAILSVAFVLMPDKDFSEQENRSLKQMPELSSDTFFSGAFASDINVYLADQFPLRNLFVKLKSGVELGFLKGENNGVLYSANQLAVKDFNAYRSRIEITPDTDKIYLDTVKAQLESVNKLGETLEIPLVTVLPPRTVDIADSAFLYNRPDGDAVFELMSNTLSEETGYIDSLALLRPKFENGEYVYYRTDHHWTTLGAYYVYCEVMKGLGCEDSIIPISEFEIEQTEDFSGTTASRANFPIYKKDILEIWHLPDDGEYKITADVYELDGFYNREFLGKSDKYSVFLDGTHAVTKIRKDGEQRKTLLVVKDSFANSLIPFLAREFDIIALDLSTSTAVSAFAELYSADAVLITFNVENIITTGHLGNLR